MKYRLTKRLYEKGFAKERVKNLYYFIDWLIGLPEALELEYLQNIYTLEESRKMPYISTAEQIGIKKGLSQGLLQGMVQGEARVLLKLLQLKFGAVEKNYREQIEHADADTLLAWSERVLDANRLDDIFKK